MLVTIVGKLVLGSVTWVCGLVGPSPLHSHGTWLVSAAPEAILERSGEWVHTVDRQPADRKSHPPHGFCWLPSCGDNNGAEGERCRRSSSCSFLPVDWSELCSLSWEDEEWAVGFLLPDLTIGLITKALATEGRKLSGFCQNLVPGPPLREAIPLICTSVWNPQWQLSHSFQRAPK